MGATFAFTEAFVANERQKDDALNGAAGGCAAGFLAGIKSELSVTGMIYTSDESLCFTERSLPLAVGSCVILGAVIGGYDYAGQLTGDPVSREERRKRFFKTPPKPLIGSESTTE
jgi:hypothetical protein